MKARFDGYLCSPEPLQIKQVLFIFNHRCVVREHFTDRKKWERERTSRTLPKEAPPGFVLKDAGKNVMPSEAPTEGYFYGVDWLPEECA